MDERITHDTNLTTLPVCPHCGSMDSDWWDGLPRIDDGDTWESSCDSCGEGYAVEVAVEYLFTTSMEADDDA